MWAYKGCPERLRLLVAKDYHANNTLRSFAPLLHLDAFHKAFKTRKGDPMWRDPEKAGSDLVTPKRARVALFV